MENFYNELIDKAYDNNGGWQNMPINSSSRMYSIDSNGFTIGKDTATKTIYLYIHT